MGKINFLGDNKNSGSAGDTSDNQADRQKSEIKWTSPEKIISSDNNNDSASDMIANIKNRLSFVDKNGQGVKKPLAGNYNFSAKKSEPEISADNNGKKSAIFGFLGDIFGSKKISDPESHKNKDLTGREFKNNKAVIADYNEVFHDEKKLRKNFKDIDAEDSDNQNSIAEDRGMLEIEGNTAVSSQNRWKAPKILKTDLIKDEVTVFIDWKKNIKNILANLTMAIIIIAIAYFALELWGKSSAQQVRTLNYEIQDLTQKIFKSNEEIKKIDDFQKNLNIADKIIGQHIYWTKFFSFLEKNTLPDINFTGGFRGDTSGKYSFTAVAPTYDGLANQVRVFKDDKDNVSAVEVSRGVLSGGEAKNASAGTGSKSLSVEFNMSLTLNPKIFLK